MGANARVNGSRAGLSIGQVLELLQGDFGDLSPSKLRFLEEQGLIAPNRTPSGYRKFSQEHIERLRLVLTLQRDHYLPLKVIAELLTEIDSGNDPVIPGATQLLASSIFAPSAAVTASELVRQADGTLELLHEAVAAGLLPASESFSRETVTEFAALVKLSHFGIFPRHLRSIRASSERDAELITHANSARGVKSHTVQGEEQAVSLAQLMHTVRGGVLKRAISQKNTDR